MFIIQKIISTIIISPGIFIIALLLVLFFSFKEKYHKTGRVLLTGIIVLIYLCSIEPTKDLFVQPLEKCCKPINTARLTNADAYIILSGGIYDNAPASLGKPSGTPTPYALYRVIEGIKLYKEQPEKIIITGGIVFDGDKSEGCVYKQMMVESGVPSEDIIVEERSRTTEENAKFTKEIMDQSGYNNPILITSAIHMKRSVYIFEKNGIEVTPDPTGYISRYKKNYGIDSYLPASSNFLAIQSAIWEYTGLIFYKIKD